MILYHLRFSQEPVHYDHDIPFFERRWQHSSKHAHRGEKTGSCLNIQDLVRNGGSCLISKRLREQAIQDLFGCASGPSSFGEYGMEDIDLNMKRCLLRAPPLFDLSARF